jgi:hypothetical protein
VPKASEPKKRGTWAANITLTSEGRMVVLGDAVVPSKVTLDAKGIRGGPDASAVFEFRKGRPECVEIVVNAHSGGRGIRSEDMNLFNIDNLIANVYSQVGMPLTIEPGGRVASASGRLDDEGIWAVRGAIAERRSRTRRTANDEELLQVAEVYRDQLKKKKPEYGGTAEALMAILGYGSERTARRRIEQARAAGYLPKTEKGQRKA